MLRPEIRLLTGHKEFRECQRLQESIWGGLSVSAEVLMVTQKIGGAVLGAFVKDNQVGFIYALLARRGGHIIHWSHTMGMLPRFRGQGLGFRLKLAHRDLALQQGIKSICWTYDPLQTRNASLNLTKLGARVEEYVVDYYGRFPSIIEQGLPSDRFVVNWRITSKLVCRRLTARKPPGDFPVASSVNLTASNSRGFLVNRQVDLSHDESQLLVEVPSNTDRMRAEERMLAKRWRMQTREIFLHYLSKGYRVDSFYTQDSGSIRPRCFYLLRRNPNR